MLIPSLVVSCALLILTLPAVTCAQPADDDFARQRQEMLNRERRVILNNDGCDVLYYPADREITPENLLDLRTTPLAGSHVDTLFYCTISSGFGFFTHNTQVGSVLDRDVPGHFGRTNQVNATVPLIEQGTDALEVMVDFCRENDMEIFWSMRMNDTHDGGHRPDAPYPLFSPVKEQHPEWLMGTFESRPRHGSWSAVDYTHPEIRELAYRYIEEVCRNYDVDGIEMDFFRHLSYFKTVAYGGQATQEELDMMTDLVRRVREMTEREGRRRGKPILVAVRVPDSVDYCRGMGFDLERWLSEGLVDILIASCYFQLNPWEYLVELGHRHGVKVYPGLSESRLRGETAPLRRNSPESYRARALRVWESGHWGPPIPLTDGRTLRLWESGADGVYLFNFFNPRAPMLHEIGDPELLARLDKTYFVTMRPTLSGGYGMPGYWLSEGNELLNIPILSPQDPLSVKAGEPAEVDLRVADDLAAAAGQGLNPQATCRIVAAGEDRLQVSLNGVVLRERRKEGALLELPLPAELLRKGANTFRLEYLPAAEGEGEDEWLVEWTAEALPAAPWQHDRFRGEVVFAELQDGALLVADRGTDGGDYMYFSYPWGATPEEESVAEVEVKVVSGWNNVIISNGVANERLMLYPDYIGTYHSRLRYEMDTTDDFHTYRMVLQGEDLLVYVDGELRLDATGKFTETAARNDIRFGAANSPEVGEALWRAVRLRSPGGATVYDLAVSVRFAD